jgi:hypothetical protein
MTQYEEQIRIDKLNELNQTRSSLVQDILLIDAQISALIPIVADIKARREAKKPNTP